jgi:hypothetical protein
MDDYYRFAGVILRISHDSGGIFSGIEQELKYYRIEGAIDPDCTASFEKRADVALPQGAVRTDVMGGQAVYLHGGRVYLAGKDNGFVIGMDFEKRGMAVEYSDEGKDLQNASRWLLKWLIIKTAERKGVTFLHASAAHYKGRNIIFCGDSHCGKSSSLIRMVRQGARAISDDSVIFDGKHIIPFTLNTSIDNDLEKRFGIASGAFDIGGYMDHSERYRNADILVFLRIWNSTSSEARPMERNKALLAMMKGYQKELGFTPYAARDRNDPELLKQIFAGYSALLENAKCFEFYAGNDEEEVRNALISFLDGA